jgi:2-polyprenyl-3-methyl-5-hydroxy-6-metoxy-1,4-benzoquinol methylase
MQQDKYNEKDKDYYSNHRHDILELIPKNVSKILEIGCGTGNTLAYLKNNGYCNWVGGVDLFPEAAKEAATKLDMVHQGNIEDRQLPVEAGSIDTILCLDVLEHLIDPHKVIGYLHTLLVPGGTIIASIPNIGYFPVIVRLLFQNKWEYGESGILDKTHLRFFVKKTAVELMESSGLSLLDVRSYPMKERDYLINLMTLGLFKDRLTTQYLIKVSNQ